MRIDACILVGAGGTGSHLVEPLARLLAYHPAADLARDVGRVSPTFIVVDGDAFEDHNAARQLGAEPGELKATVAARTARRVFPAGCVEGVAGYLDRLATAELLASMDASSPLVVLAVDNHASRREIMLAFEDRCETGLLLSPGNEVSDGSVLAWARVAGRNVTPSPLECGPDGNPAHPELYRPADRMPGGCLEQAPSTPQLIAANAYAATITLGLVQAWLDGGELPTETAFDTKRHRVRPLGVVDLAPLERRARCSK